jgi:hypothetical protein
MGEALYILKQGTALVKRGDPTLAASNPSDFERAPSLE